MKRCLVVLRTSRIAGAERIGLAIVNDLRERYQIDVATIESFDDIRTIFFGKYELIHTHLFLPGLLVRIRRLFYGRFRWIHTVHYCNYAEQKWGKTKSFLDRKWIFPKADRLVAVSSAVYKMIRDFHRAELIPNAFAVGEKRAPGRIWIPERLRIGTIAMLREEKGVADLLRAWPEVRRHFPFAELRIAGDGPERANLEGMIRSLRLDGVKLLGYVDDVNEFLGELDVYVSPSFTESFGLALFEAMQFSLPIVARAVEASPEALQNGEFGLVIPREADFARALSLHLSTIVEQPREWQERSHRGLRFHEGRLRPEIMLHNYARVYAGELRPGICMVCPIVTQATGGMQRQMNLQSRELVRRGFRVFVLQREDRGPGPRRPDWSHVTFLFTPDLLGKIAPDSRFHHRLRGLAFICFGVLRLWSHRRDLRFVHAHQLFSATLVGVMAKWLTGMRLVVKVTASGELGELRELRRSPFLGLRRRAFRSIDRVIVLSSEMEFEMKELGFGDERIRLVPNGVEIPSPSFAKLAYEKSADGKLHILYCGRLSREKCLSDLLRASVVLTSRGVANHVHLVGGTYGGRDTTSALNELAQELGIFDNVTFYGFREDVREFYRSSDVFVLPSVSEGMSNALLEALAYGIPCVASDIIPNRALIRSGENGWLFRQGDANDLADKIEILANASGQSFARQARERIAENFSVEAIGGKLQQLYGELGDESA